MHEWVDDVGDAGGRLFVSSDLLRTEAVRAARRSRLPLYMLRVEDGISQLDLIRIDAARYTAAGVVDPPELRSLDAIHLAAALSLADDLEGLVTYDGRLAAAARAHGITVVSPGADGQ